MPRVDLAHLPVKKPYLWIAQPDGEKVLEGYVADQAGDFSFLIEIPSSAERLFCYGGDRVLKIALHGPNGRRKETPEARELDLSSREWTVVEVVFIVEDRLPAKLAVRFE